MLSHRSRVRNLAAILVSAAAISTACAAPDFSALNAVFGVPIWQDENLWDDVPDDAAARLGWPMESKTSTDSSFRKYPPPSEVVLGTRPYSLALFGEEGGVGRISMMFANKGDSVGGALVAGSERSSRESRRIEEAYAAAIEKDQATIAAALSGLLGEPVRDRFGQGRETRERVQRWDWNGHAILLASPPGEYVAVRILPTAVAELQGRSRIPDTVLRGRLLERVERRPNGDVILKDIPMVDQGPKGYCVPATWERVMRYMAVPADMYVLAMAGGTQAGGGTSLSAIVSGAEEAVSRGGRRLDTERGKISLRNIRKFIDRGIPVMWGMFSMEDVNSALNDRMKDRAAVADWNEWNAKLDSVRKSAKNIATSRDRGHMCMIIGYNEKTGEIAVSDSWGPEYAERWMTVEEANAVSQNVFTVINF
ncbi:MAG: hypothetical protein SFU53_15150 [Terrimicrobiaceae bacterium]|nr:hypothetical protein [Terrimicrobiaceae bacterium]